MENNIKIGITVTSSSANIKLAITEGENFIDTTLAKHMVSATIYMRDLDQIEQFARDLIHQVIDARLDAEKNKKQGA